MVSFRPLLDEPDRPWKTAAFSHYPKGGNLGTAMRTDRYRYVEWVNKKGGWSVRELYDHRTDPAENVNIADRSENATLLADLGRQMKAGWKAAVPPSKTYESGAAATRPDCSAVDGDQVAAASTRDAAGMPCTISSFTDAQIDAG